MIGDDGLMVKAVSPKIFSPLKNKFVSSVATFAENCLAVIRVPGLEDVTEGLKGKIGENRGEEGEVGDICIDLLLLLFLLLFLILIII